MKQCVSADSCRTAERTFTLPIFPPASSRPARHQREFFGKRFGLLLRSPFCQGGRTFTADVIGTVEVDVVLSFINVRVVKLNFEGGNVAEVVEQNGRELDIEIDESQVLRCFVSLLDFGKTKVSQGFNQTWGNTVLEGVGRTCRDRFRQGR